MANKQPTASTQDLKKKKKKWIPIYASKDFNNQEIGETFLEESEQALGRVIEVNLMMLTRDPKKQNFNVYFKVNEVKNNIASTELVKYRMQVAQLKRITKKGKNKVDDSAEYLTQDNVKVDIKPILISKALTYKTTLKLIRKETRDFLTKHVKELTYAQLMRDTVNGGLQKDIRSAIKKAYPVTGCMLKEVSRIN